MGSAAARMPELFSFADYCKRAGLSRVLTRGFQEHVKQNAGDFNYRSDADWDRLKSEFLATPRRRA